MKLYNMYLYIMKLYIMKHDDCLHINALTHLKG